LLAVSEIVCDIVIEVPKGSRNKYEYDPERNTMRLDRRLLTAMTYPADYGFIPDTLAEDGDALDAMVLVDEPTFPGCVVPARPVGVLWMEDEKGPDAKIVCVPDPDPLWKDVKEIDQLPEPMLAEIEHFFDVYKMLEEKKTSVEGFQGRAEALKEIEASRRRRQDDQP
jgi:inorganic pyrophosphatase